MNIRDKIIEVAEKEVGYVEQRDAQSGNITKYGAWYGLNRVAWCAIFVSWVYDQAGAKLGKVDTAKGYHYCPSAFNFWRKNKKITTLPERGDIVLFDWDANKLSDHTGIFLRWINQEKTIFEAIEGNTSPRNASNGGQVMKTVRYRKNVQAFVNVL